MTESYFARGNQVFYLHPIEVTEELFVTVHPTKDSTQTPEQQAEHLADLLNRLPTRPL